MLAKYLMAYVTYLAYNIWKFVKQRNIVRVCTAYLVVKVKIRYSNVMKFLTLFLEIAGWLVEKSRKFYNLSKI